MLLLFTSGGDFLSFELRNFMRIWLWSQQFRRKNFSGKRRLYVDGNRCRQNAKSVEVNAARTEIRWYRVWIHIDIAVSRATSCVHVYRRSPASTYVNIAGRCHILVVTAVMDARISDTVRYLYLRSGRTGRTIQLVRNTSIWHQFPEWVQKLWHRSRRYPR